MQIRNVHRYKSQEWRHNCNISKKLKSIFITQLLKATLRFWCLKHLIGLDDLNPYLFNVSVIFQCKLMILMLPNWFTLRGKAELTNCHDVKSISLLFVQLLGIHICICFLFESFPNKVQDNFLKIKINPKCCQNMLQYLMSFSLKLHLNLIAEEKLFAALNYKLIILPYLDIHFRVWKLTRPRDNIWWLRDTRWFL